MARKLDIGYRADAYVVVANTLNYTPQADRAGIIRSITIDNRSADDTWRLTVGGREIMAFRENAAGQQQLLRMLQAASVRALNWFDWCRNVMDIDPSVPVPQGLTATLKSDGGATADLLFEVEERDPGDINPTMLNHYAGSQFVVPLIRPAWMPNIVQATPVPANWLIELLALFTEGGGVNTFSGAANHTSVTKAIELLRNGQFLFTHAQPDGLLDHGNAAAAGSANAVLTQLAAHFTPFQQSENDYAPVLDVPIRLGMGDNLDMRFSFVAAGDTTGGADYSKFLQVAVARITRPAGV